MPESAHNVQTYPNATPFLDKMRARLEASEARNGLMLGLALRVEQDPHYYGDGDPYFATVAEPARKDDGNIIAAALMTPPHGVVLYCDSAEETAALNAIAHNLYTAKWGVPTVHGPSSAAARFAAIWCELTDAPYSVGMEQRAFELREVIQPRDSPGYLRAATMADYDLAIQWFRAFGREAIEDEDEAQLHKAVTQKMTDGYLFFWEDEEPVSMAGLTRPTARGIAIGPVYTPPDQRGRGYASSAVARLSQDMLDAGKEFCALFTDLANPTSNSIYQKIGYRAVGDFSQYRFSVP